jgi:transcriptional regulator with XRE-family HTH domain
MGYRGKLAEQQRARELRAQAWTLREIADDLGVAKSSVSVWTRGVAFDRNARRSATTGRRARGSDHPLRRRKLEEIERLRVEGIERVGSLTDRELLMAGLGLYAGDGSKRGGEVRFANSDPRLIRLFCVWFRRFFDVDRARLRVRLYLHEGLDLPAATAFWSEVTEIPESQFTKPYRATPVQGIRNNKHEHGCAHVAYGCTHTHRRIMGLMEALVSAEVVAPGAGLEPATFALTVRRSAN